jgi:hypothetical protein
MHRSALALLLASVTGVAQAQSWLDRPGVPGTQIVSIGGAQVKLPPGAWLFGGDSAVATGGGRGNIVRYKSSLYYQSNGQCIVAIARVLANADPFTSPGRGTRHPPKSCYRTDVYFSDNRNLYPGQFDCLMVTDTNLAFKTAPKPEWQGLIDKAGGIGGMPRPMIVAEFQQMSLERQGTADVQIFVNPAVAGFDGAPTPYNPWRGETIGKAHAAYLEKVAVWARAYRKIIATSWASW